MLWNANGKIDTPTFPSENSYKSAKHNNELSAFIVSTVFKSQMQRLRVRKSIWERHRASKIWALLPTSPATATACTPPKASYTIVKASSPPLPSYSPSNRGSRVNLQLWKVAHSSLLLQTPLAGAMGHPCVTLRLPSFGSGHTGPV